MNVAFDATGLIGYTGINVYTRNLATSLAHLYPSDGYTLLTTYRKLERVASQFDEKKRDPLRWDNPFPHPLVLGKWGTPLTEVYYKRIFRNQADKYDLLHSTNPFYYPEIHSSRAVATVHDIIPLYEEHWQDPAPRKRIRRKIQAMVRAKAVVFVPSFFVRDELLNNFDFDPEKLFVTYEAAGPEFGLLDCRSEDLLRFGLSEHDQFFVFVGRIDKRKNVERLIEAYEMLSEDVRHATKLILIANGSPEQQEEFKKLIRHDPNIIHLLNVSNADLALLLNRSVGMLFVSFHEGFGIPILEAMNCGCPVLTSNVSSMPEIAADAAMLVDPYDTQAIRDAMFRLATESTLRDLLREKGLQRAKEFSWDRCARETHVGYEVALGS
jgi:glycosyltransferase involved in cell wall biosynthesis